MQMQHGFDLQHDYSMNQSQPDNVHYLRDNNGAFIYYDQRDNFVFMNNSDVFNNYLSPNTQQQQNYQQQPQMMPVQQAPTKSSSVIHHLVASNLGPGKFGTFGGCNSFYDPAISNNNLQQAAPLNISIPSLLEHVKTPTSFADESSSPPKIINNNHAVASNNNNNVENIQPNLQNVGGNKKQRIVAEVKPMRMSYSDVVSKNAAINGNSQVPNNSHSSNSSSSSPNTTMPVNNVKNVKKYDKKQSFETDKNRKSPTTISNNSDGSFKKSPAVKLDKPSTPPSVPKQQAVSNSGGAKKRKLQTTKESSEAKIVQPAKENRQTFITDSERSSTIGSDDDDDDDGDEIEVDLNDEDFEEYCVRKNLQGEHHKVEKIRAHKRKQQVSQEKSKKSERVQKRVSVKSSRKQKHEFIQKILASCLEYVLIFAKWLWMLVYDVGYMSFGIIWDRLNWSFSYVNQGVIYARRELSGNPGRALVTWLKNVWKKFDAKFAKKSKWAFWRYMFKRKDNGENSKDAYKDGKLPKTAEEAMKSLLNCKEKDAYSILGVSPDCPQEQIKKHYKKIAVLVHPDKNKQAGAEEAFKVLQRSFELIGEPVSFKKCIKIIYNLYF
jgi:DnaJ family protein C protein 14